MRRFDCFMFRDELDMLEMRLHELDGQVDRHVIVESPFTHRGIAKPLVFDANKERFRPWLDRITYLVADPDMAMPWAREHAQRDHVWPYLDTMGADEREFTASWSAYRSPKFRQPYSSILSRLAKTESGPSTMRASYPCHAPEPRRS